ncbi:CHAT domain-containing protein [Candidatus Omnitrophota bacterium]
MQAQNTWILEITCQNKQLSMSLYEKEQVSTLKTISTLSVDFARIGRINNEIIAIINKANQRRLPDDNSIVELQKNTRLLYELLLTRQVKNRLSSLGSINLLLSLDERLITLPWELLFDGKDFLCLKFDLGRSIRTQAFPLQPQRPIITGKPKMLILVNPTGDLRSAYREGLYIKEHLSRNDNISVDFKSQEIDSAYLCKNLHIYDIVHFAGHCEYDTRNPEESGWVLSDGIICARDFLALGESTGLPSIVFVNACESARTASNLINTDMQNNIYGLGQAFLFVGARHYIGSYWNIEDGASQEFAEEFYNQIASGCSVGQAIRLARLRLFKRKGISTIAWAGYVLYGDPAFVMLSSVSKSALAKMRFEPRIPKITKRRAAILGLVLAAIAFSFALVKILPAFNPQASFLYSQAEELYAQGKNSKVISLLSRIISGDSQYLPAWKLRGDMYFRLGRFSDALADYFDYARISEKSGQYKHLASAYIKIGWIYHMCGDYQKSQEFYQKAFNLSRKHEDKLNEADAMARLAVWHIDKGDNEAAFSLLMKSSEINRQRSSDIEHRFNLACDYFNIGFLYTERDDYAAAKEFYRKSEDIFQGLGEIPELSDYYFNMGEIALFEKRYDSALEFYQKGLALDEQLGHKFNLSSDYWMLGEFYWETGKLNRAESYFKQGILACQEINNYPVLAGIYYDLGLMYKEIGQSQKAKNFLSLALKLYKNIDTPDYQEVQKEYLALE